MWSFLILFVLVHLCAAQVPKDKASATDVDDVKVVSLDAGPKTTKLPESSKMATSKTSEIVISGSEPRSEAQRGVPPGDFMMGGNTFGGGDTGRSGGFGNRGSSFGSERGGFGNDRNTFGRDRGSLGRGRNTFGDSGGSFGNSGNNLGDRGTTFGNRRNNLGNSRQNRRGMRRGTGGRRDNGRRGTGRTNIGNRNRGNRLTRTGTGNRGGRNNRNRGGNRQPFGPSMDHTGHTQEGHGNMGTQEMLDRILGSHGNIRMDDPATQNVRNQLADLIDHERRNWARDNQRQCRQDRPMSRRRQKQPRRTGTSRRRPQHLPQRSTESPNKNHQKNQAIMSDQPMTSEHAVTPENVKPIVENQIAKDKKENNKQQSEKPVTVGNRRKGAVKGKNKSRSGGGGVGGAGGGKGKGRRIKNKGGAGKRVNRKGGRGKGRGRGKGKRKQTTAGNVDMTGDKVSKDAGKQAA